MRKYIFPRYEEFWGMLKAAGKEVIFMVDGCMDAFADDVFACGARGIISEPYTDYKAIARQLRELLPGRRGRHAHPHAQQPGGDQRHGRRMVETAHMTGGYFMDRQRVHPGPPRPRR